MINIHYDEREEFLIKNEQYTDLEKIKEKGLECSICLHVISSSVAITECLHKFCSICIYEYCRTSQNPTCPLCRTDIDIDDIILSPDLTNFLENSQIRCKNIECKEIYTRNLNHDHTATCDWNKFKCSDCGDIFYGFQKLEHQSVCVKRVLKCDRCQIFYKKSEETEHNEKICPFYTISCTNPECDYSCLRKDMNSHREHCPQATTTCIDCKAVIYKKEYRLHSEICPEKLIKCERCNEFYIHRMYIEHKEECHYGYTNCKFCNTEYMNHTRTAHEKICIKRPIQCIHKCGAKIEREFINIHYLNCPNRIVKCKKCKQSIVLSNEKQHKQVCPEMKIVCSECNETIVKKNIFDHEFKCSYKTVCCKYEYAGCKYNFFRLYEEEHYEINKDEHLELLDKYIKDKFILYTTRNEYDLSEYEEDEI
jgi:hypothetical protein